MNLLYKLVRLNIKPICLIVLSTVIGTLGGNPIVGFLVGIGIVATITLLF